MNPWNLIGWAIVALVVARILRAGAAGVRAGRKMAADIRRSLTTTPEVGQRWRWYGSTRRLLDVLPDGSVRIDGDALQMSPPVLSPERWQAEIRAGRLVRL